jgi:hypothetical protein
MRLISFRNINPRHTYAEPGRYNKARHHCHLYIDVILRETFMNPAPPVEPNVTNQQITDRMNKLFNTTTMPTCHKLHYYKMCDVDWRSWVRDFYDTDAADDYESQYETENDMLARLGELPPSSDGDTYLPGQAFPSSSMGPNYPR